MPGLRGFGVFSVTRERRPGPLEKSHQPFLTRQRRQRMPKKNYSKFKCARGWAGSRSILASDGRWDGIRPAVVITTTPVGMRACENLLGERELATLFESCCHLTEYEYRYWCKEEPDTKFQFHINYWAWIKTSIPSVRMHEFRMYPIPKNNKYWLLRHGVNGLGEHDYADCQVHSWNGESTKLLAEHFHEGVPSV